MSERCDYRSPCRTSGPSFVGPPDFYICACPAGEAVLGLNCINDAKRCKIAQHYEHTGLPSYAYKWGKRLIKKQREEIARIVEGLPSDLADIVRKKYELPTGKEIAKCQSRA